MNKLFAILILILCSSVFCSAQKHKKNEILKIKYQSYYSGANETDTSFTFVIVDGNKTKIIEESEKPQNPIPGLADIFTFTDNDNNKLITQLVYSESEKYYSESPFKNENIKFEEKGNETVLGYNCKKLFTSINSNSIEIWTTNEFACDATPLPNLGYIDGVVIKYRINGNYVTEFSNIEKLNKKGFDFPKEFGTKKAGNELSKILKKRLIISTSVFNEEQIYFKDIDKFTDSMPFDTTIHFSAGTLILKRIKMPKLPLHYQVFVELSEKSAGDAYDRTGSVFVIPQNRELSFYDALSKDLDVIPSFTANNKKNYQGMLITENYLPLIELVRFFTPFGVNHFNDKSRIDGLEWEDKVFYKQEITDLSSAISGDILIGAFIGNYDGGGHKISLDIKAYPQEYEWNTNEEENQWILPIFNTCNVMEMSGQNYGSFFETDSLTVDVEIPEGISNLRLRYISTGHGGWDGGDEFNPKENKIIIDGIQQFAYTPWRSDCGTFREYNPVSGNFWNGVSSSDYSRSGWCPGTATQPTYFDLSFLSPGKHKISIAIPQGADEGSSFNAWNISGVLIGKIKNN